MSTLADPARVTQHRGTRAGEQIVANLLPLATQLVGCVHDHGPDARDQILAQVPDDAWPQLAVVLAALVDPTRTVRESLAWLNEPRSLDGSDWDLQPEAWSNRRGLCPDGCGEMVLQRHLTRHRRRRHGDTQVA